MNKSILYILLTIVITSFSAQFEIVKDIAERPGDLSVQKYPKKDVNGDWCALLKVFTDIKDVQFKGNGYENHDYRDGIYYVYMFNGSKDLTFIKDGYTTKPHTFPFKLNSNKVYSIEIKGIGEERKIVDVAITIQTEPADAQVYIDEKQYKQSEKIVVPIGKRNLRITRENYEPVNKEIDVSEKDNFFPIELQKVKKANIFISSVPEGAMVYIDGSKYGETTLSDFHPTGTYKIRLVKDGYLELEENIEIQYPETKKNYDLIKNAGTIKVITSPEKNMDIYINGTKRVEKADFTFKEMQPGKYKIKAQSKFYETEEKEFELKVGGSETIELKSVPTYALLTIETDPNAEVFLNGQRITQLKDIILEPQKCNIEVKMNKAEAITETIILKKNDRPAPLKLYPKVAKGTVQVAVALADASIELKGDSGELYKVTGSALNEEVPVGSYDLRISKKGYKVYNKRFTLEQGKIIKETGIKLEKQPVESVLIPYGESYNTFKPANADEWGQLKIKTVQKDTQIYANGKLIGKGEVAVDAYEGEYQIKLENSDALSETFSAPVEVFKETFVDINLVDSKNEYSKLISIKKEYKTWEDFYENSKSLNSDMDGKYHFCEHFLWMALVGTCDLTIAGVIMDLAMNKGGVSAKTQKQRVKSASYLSVAESKNKHYGCATCAMFDKELYTEVLSDEEIRNNNNQLKSEAQQKALNYNSEIKNKEDLIKSNLKKELEKSFIKYRIGTGEWKTIPSSFKLD